MKWAKNLAVTYLEELSSFSWTTPTNLAMVRGIFQAIFLFNAISQFFSPAAAI